jgi:hypothetical protein
VWSSGPCRRRGDTNARYGDAPCDLEGLDRFLGGGVRTLDATTKAFPRPFIDRAEADTCATACFTTSQRKEVKCASRVRGVPLAYPFTHFTRRATRRPLLGFVPPFFWTAFSVARIPLSAAFVLLVRHVIARFTDWVRYAPVSVSTRQRAVTRVGFEELSV